MNHVSYEERRYDEKDFGKKRIVIKNKNNLGGKMNERLTVIAAIMGAKLLARRIKKRKKEKRSGEKPRRRETPLEKEKRYFTATGYIFGEASRELGREIGAPFKAGEVHYKKGWDLPFQTHPQLGDLDRWKEYVKKRAWLSTTTGSMLGLPLFSGTTAIILTRDGRLFHLPEGEDDFETVINIWEPFFQYIEKKARKISSEQHKPFDQAIGEVLRELGLEVSHPRARIKQDMRWQAEVVIFSNKELPEKKKQFLHALKKVYMDELGLDWMPLPLVHSDLHHINPEESGFRVSNRAYLEELPNILRELGVDPESPIIKKRLEALHGLLHKIHWPDYWDARTALALAEALHSEGKITDQEYEEFLDLAAKGEAEKLIARARELAGKYVPLEEEEKPIHGVKMLAHPDRYSIAVQKFLIKALILGEYQRQGDGVHKNLYRVFRDLVSSPLITSNWKPWIADWLERLEKGEKASPLRHFLENLPLNPRLKAEAYRYLARIERGESINDIPEDEKKRFLEAVERIKQEIWRNPEKYHEVFTDLAYVKGLNPDLSRKALVGLIHDLAQIYVGRKSLAELDLERDATQIYYTIRNLQDLGNYVDPSIVARRLREIIETHIQDEDMRKAYLEALNHYVQTQPDIPRNERFLEALLEREKELEQRLTNMKLPHVETVRVRSFYRALLLTTAEPSLSDLKRLYSKILPELTVRIDSEEFIPQHGTVATIVATIFTGIREAGENVENLARKEASKFESLSYAEPYIEKEILNLLAIEHPEGTSTIIPREKHEKFIKHLEKLQTRKPIE